MGNAEFSAVNCRFDGAGREFFARVVKDTLQFMPDAARERSREEATVWDGAGSAR